MPRQGWTLSASPGQVLDRLGIPQALRRGLFAAGSRLQASAQDQLRTPGKGDLYDVHLITVQVGEDHRVVPDRRAGPRTPHRASKAGDPPAPDTGAGWTSVQVAELEADRVRVGTDKFYLRVLNDGMGPGFPHGPHPAGIVIEPRPWAEPALEEAREDMTAEMRRELSGLGVRVA